MIGRLIRYYHRLESNPSSQYRFHKRMVRFWLLNFIPMNVVVAIDIWATLSGNTTVALLMTAILLAINTNYSLYANFDTEFGDAHSAYASMKADSISEDISQPQAQAKESTPEAITRAGEPYNEHKNYTA